MKKTKQEQIYNIDEIEDLTLFANESFDTQEVDLFEFSSEESSPLTRLKSIILSLDWEINDETLQELADELQNLQTTWQGDKVAEVYLQGLEKIGRYIRSKGAYAHPNSIKLLLTFFYNFEKITSSPNLTGEDITKILKSDIRKFKILQFQINQSEESGSATVVPPPSPQGAPVIPVSVEASASDPNPLKLLKAAILSLDWEVTDDSLRQFNDRLDQYQETVSDDKLVMVMVQGLRVLGSYIGEERAEAHPESFPLLHSFSEALEYISLIGHAAADQNKVQDILVEQINRLNNLKLLIAAPQGSSIDEQLIDEVVGEISMPVAMEHIAEEPFAQTEAEKVAPLTIDTPTVSPAIAPAAANDEQGATLSLESELDILFGTEAKPAMESADTQYPDEILPPEAITPVEDELADDLIEASLHARRGLTPALSGVEDTFTYQDDTDQTDIDVQEDLNQQLDDLFAEAVHASSVSPALSPDLGEAPSGDDASPAGLSISASAAEDEDEEEDDYAASGSPHPEDTGSMPIAALSDVEVPEEMAESSAITTGTEEGLTDLDAKLDSFFGADADETPVTATSSTVDTELELAMSNDRQEGREETVAALSDVEEPEDRYEPETPASEIEIGMSDLDAKLDSFFGEEPLDVAPPAPSLSDETEVTTLLENEASAPAAATAAPSLEDSELVGMPMSSEELAQASLAIESELDGLFSDDGTASVEEHSTSTPTGPTVEEVEHSLYFGGENPVVTALADSDEDKGFSEEEALAALEYTPLDEIEENLHSFFDAEAADAFVPEETDQPDAVAEQRVSAEGPTNDEAAPALASDLFAEFEKDEEKITPALASSGDDIPVAEALFPAVTAKEDVADKELSETLDFFFDGPTEDRSPADAEADDSPVQQQQFDELLALEEEIPALSSDLLSDIQETSDDVAPALAAVFDGYDHEQAPVTPAGTNGEPVRELDDELDLFFAAEENTALDSATETVSELTQALEATLDDTAPTAAALTGAGPEGMEVILASLGAVLPAVVRTPGRGPVTESMRLLDRLQYQASSPEHRSLAQLLTSTVSLLGRTAGKNTAETEKLVNFLYEQLLRTEINTSAVTEAVNRFAGWMQNLCATMPLVPEQTGEMQEPRFEYTAKELYFELSELRASFRDELAKLRHEMHHRT